MPTAALRQQPTTQYVTIMLGEQMFGIPVLEVHDVLKDQTVNRIPLAPTEVAGSLNLRGRIVTAIDMRRKLGMGHFETAGESTMGVVVEYDGEKYCLLVDDVGDVLTLENAVAEKAPSTLDARWRSVSQAVFKLEKTLLLILDTDKLFSKGN